MGAAVVWVSVVFPLVAAAPSVRCRLSTPTSARSVAICSFSFSAAWRAARKLPRPKNMTADSANSRVGKKPRVMWLLQVRQLNHSTHPVRSLQLCAPELRERLYRLDKLAGIDGRVTPSGPTVKDIR